MTAHAVSQLILWSWTLGPIPVGALLIWRDPKQIRRQLRENGKVSL